MLDLSKKKGDAAEQAAARFLKKQGLPLIEHNYRCRFGEIDLIARDGPMLIFVEVRCRQSKRFGSAAESVNWRKQQRLIAAASHYLATVQGAELRCRFDVIEASACNGGFDINWLQNAFQ